MSKNLQFQATLSRSTPRENNHNHIFLWCICIHCYFNQTICGSKSRVVVIGKNTLILVKCFRTTRITAKVEWDKLLAGDMARSMTWETNQLLDLLSGHTYFQFGEWRAGGRKNHGSFCLKCWCRVCNGCRSRGRSISLGRRRD